MFDKYLSDSNHTDTTVLADALVNMLVMLLQAGSGSIYATKGDEHTACPPPLTATNADPSPAVSAPTGPQKVTLHPEPFPCHICTSVQKMVHVLA